MGLGLLTVGEERDKVIFDGIFNQNIPERMMPMISLVAKMKSRPGMESRLAEVCMNLARTVRENEKGCLAYIPHVSVKDPSEIIFYEQYESQEALEIHRKTPYFQAAFAEFKELLAGPSEVTILKKLV